MDADRFDNVARSLIAGSSRRTLLGLVIGGIAAALGVADGEARNQRKKCKRCGPCRACKRGKCKSKPNGIGCGGTKVCQSGTCVCPTQCCANADCGACEICQGGQCIAGCQGGKSCQGGTCVCHPGRRTVKAPASRMRSAAAPAPRAKHAAPTLASARMCGTIRLLWPVRQRAMPRWRDLRERGLRAHVHRRAALFHRL